LSESVSMHRVYMELDDFRVWYKIIREANKLYGKNWRGQQGVKRRLTSSPVRGPQMIWFEVPDEKFATWIALKYAVTPVAPPGK